MSGVPTPRSLATPRVPDTDDRNLQQFITHSKWSARELLDHVAHDANELIGDATDAVDTRLYLPKEWTDDVERCNKAGIPECEGCL